MIKVTTTNERNKACPCLYTTPCHPRCTCVMPYSSSGCHRCCTYGSPEQRKAKAEYLARFIDAGWAAEEEKEKSDGRHAGEVSR